ncbi:DUF4278 domain-containing protein [Thermoleptolyngbya sp.]|jgi:hypothetical protein
MQLSYRGAEYIPCTELPATSQSFYGYYRGAEMTIRHSSELPVQPFVNLTYRGAQYRPEAAPLLSNTAAIAL